MRKDCPSFSDQELKIIRELSRNASYKSISKRLDISIKTVEYYIRNLKDKTGATDKKSLLKYFDGLIDINTCKHKRKSDICYILVASLLLLALIYLCFYRPWESGSHVNFNNTSRCFIERRNISKRIDSALRSWNDIATAIIVGYGGAGKTTVARRIVERSDAVIKFEINAETEKTLVSSFFELGDQLANTRNLKLELDIIRSLKDLVHQKKRLIRFIAMLLKQSNNWFLLFDNVRSMKYVCDFLPINKNSWGCGKVLITTRNQNVIDSSLIKRDQIIDIGKLSEFEKRNLFSIIVYDCNFSKLSRNDQDVVGKFLKMIPEFPLDVCAAAYYIKNTKISLDDYIALMQKSIKELSSEQKELLSENANYDKTRYSIVNSTLSELTKDRKQFMYLLAMICLMDSQNIPKNILRRAIGSIDADNFIRRLKDHSFATDSGDEISIHRSTHAIGLNFSIENMSTEELFDCVHLLVEALRNETQLRILAHAESVIEKISKMQRQELVRDEASLLIKISDIIREKTYRMTDALNKLKRSIELKNCFEFWNEKEQAIVHLKAGEIYTIINQNSNADHHLQASLRYFERPSTNKAKNLRLLGIVRMRQHRFNEADQCFSEALRILKEIQMNNTEKKLITADIYENIAFNCFMDGINRKNAKLAVPLMEKAISILNDSKIEKLEKVVSRKAVHQMKLAGIYNALANYQKALDMADETESLIKRSGIENCDTFYVKGLIARERGLSYLRMNSVFKAYRYFTEARQIFTKLMKGDYLFKLKNHEAECLIRMNRLNEALEVCKSALKEKNRERNNYSDLFFNTCYYHAAVATYHLKDVESSKKYFREFLLLMNELCQNILDEKAYKTLLKNNTFNNEQQNIRDYFEKSLQIFEAIYWKGYEFTKYYVKLNIK